MKGHGVPPFDIPSNKCGIDAVLTFKLSPFSISGQELVDCIYLAGAGRIEDRYEAYFQGIERARGDQRAQKQLEEMARESQKRMDEIAVAIRKETADMLAASRKQTSDLSVQGEGGYFNHCWNCGGSISSRQNTKCPVCGWYKCSCGACGCNYKRPAF